MILVFHISPYWAALCIMQEMSFSYASNPNHNKLPSVSFWAVPFVLSFLFQWIAQGILANKHHSMLGKEVKQ